MAFKYHDEKFRRWEKLDPNDQVDLLYDLLSSFSLLKNLEDSSLFITDLLTKGEVRILSKRLRIAKLLLQGWQYEELSDRLKVSHSTIAKVASWLMEKGEGFRKIIARIPPRKRVKHWTEETDWDRLKKNRRENKKLRSTLDTLSSKDVIRHNVDEQYRDFYKNRKRK